MSSCVYFIKNKITNDIYIGSTVNFSKRRSTHKRDLLKGSHHSVVLQRAYNKYGKNNFIYEIFIECQKNDTLIVEQFCIDFLNPKYNTSKDAIAPMKNRKHSKSTIKKFKNIKRNRGSKHHLYGTTWSSELREKMLKSRIGSKRSEATKKKMSDTAKRINSIARIDRTKQMKKVVDNLGNIFDSCGEAAKFHGISQATLTDILKGRHIQTRKGVSFDYV